MAATFHKNIPNLISASRGVAALALLFTPVFGVPFWILYGWCGISDMIDGPLARRLDAVSRRGSVIDSIADLIFVLAAIIKIFPVLTLPAWIWWWVGAIAVVKITTAVLAAIRHADPEARHSVANKATGLLLFLFPISIQWLSPTIPAALCCLSATISILFTD